MRVASYWLMRRLAVGGMSEVHIAQPVEGAAPAREVVIKRLLPSLIDDASSRACFEMEAELHAAARHANIVEVFETGTFDDEPYIAMEYVEGADLGRVLAHARAEERALPIPLAIYIGRELMRALGCVHRLTDSAGAPLGAVHRDVTPSNIFLSIDGEVKLGDFGIASLRAEIAPLESSALKGKYCYLSPEQVGSEPFDHRSDLFSATVVIAEMILGKPLFTGAGQLAVLLSIRDARIDALQAVEDRMPEGLFPVLARALSRHPSDRFSSAEAMLRALEPFETPDRTTLQHQLAGWVAGARSGASVARRVAGALQAHRRSSPFPAASSTSGAVRVTPRTDDAQTAPPSISKAGLTKFPELPSSVTVRHRGHSAVQDVPFAKLVEMIATGQLAPEDEVDLGAGFSRLVEIGSLSRYLPHTTGTTRRVEGPGVPDYVGELSAMPMPEVLAWVLGGMETGVLFCERLDATHNLRKELYFEEGRLIMAASNEPRELLGEYLIRRGLLDRGELEMALLTMHSYDGQLGDTLVALGLVETMDVFQALRDQGRDRVADIFQWPAGRVSFYRGVEPQRVDFRLELDVATLLLAGFERSTTSLGLIERYSRELREAYRVVTPQPRFTHKATLPSSVMALLRALGATSELCEALDRVSRAEGITWDDSLRALEVGRAIGIIEKVPKPAGA